LFAIVKSLTKIYKSSTLINSKSCEFETLNSKEFKCSEIRSISEIQKLQFLAFKFSLRLKFKMTEEWNLKRLKAEYIKFEKKFKLPDFNKLNEEFDIERISEKETDYVLREIRKTIADKLIAYIRFVETMMNPSNGPMFFFMVVKGFTLNDKNLVDTIYKKLAKYEIDVIDLDNKYNEKKEAEFISRIYKEWQDVKEDIDSIVKVIRENLEKVSEKADKEYFG